MKDQRLLLAGVALLLAHAFLSIAPPLLEVDSSPFEDISPAGSAAQTSGDACQVVRAAVVTIYAGKEFGSGSVVSPEGLVITNNHVVKDAKDNLVWVKTIVGNRYRGQVTATDPINDLALVQLNAQETLPAVQLYDADNVETGQQVCAIGSPFNKPGVLTRGTLTTILSNGDLQSTLRLFPGNSGGPLLNDRGEMIGVNKAIWQSRTGENSGISYATSVAVARTFIQQNSTKSREIAPVPSSISGLPSLPSQPENRHFNSSNLSPQPSTSFGQSSNFSSPGVLSQSTGTPRLGVMIDRQTLEIQIVEPTSLAASAGLRSGDQLIAIDGHPLQSIDQLQAFLSRRPISATITFRRNQQQESLQVVF